MIYDTSLIASHPIIREFTLSIIKEFKIKKFISEERFFIDADLVPKIPIGRESILSEELPKVALGRESIFSKAEKKPIKKNFLVIKPVLKKGIASEKQEFEIPEIPHEVIIKNKEPVRTEIKSLIERLNPLSRKPAQKEMQEPRVSVAEKPVLKKEIIPEVQQKSVAEDELNKEVVSEQRKAPEISREVIAEPVIIKPVLKKEVVPVVIQPRVEIKRKPISERKVEPKVKIQHKIPANEIVIEEIPNKPVLKKKIEPVVIRPRVEVVERKPIIKPIVKKVEPIKIEIQPKIPEPRKVILEKKQIVEPIKVEITPMKVNVPVKLNLINFPDEDFGEYGRMTPLIKDPFVYYIECTGANEPIKVIKGGQKRLTNIVLSKEEIQRFLEGVSDKLHLPLFDGVFRALVDNFMVNAMVSNITGSKFTIKKQSYYLAES